MTSLRVEERRKEGRKEGGGGREGGGGGRRDRRRGEERREGQCNYDKNGSEELREKEVNPLLWLEQGRA